MRGLGSGPLSRARVIERIFMITAFSQQISCENTTVMVQDAAPLCGETAVANKIPNRPQGARKPQPPRSHELPLT